MSDVGVAPVVFVVDDESLILDLVKDALEEAGFQVKSATEFTEAISILDACGTELTGLVTDISLGAKGTGWEVARRARELNPNLAVVYMSGDSAAEWHAQGVPQSVMVPKPFAPTQVVVAVASLANTTDTD